MKLYGSILDSSIWSEPAHIRLVWITMLAMADENGYVGASVGGLARRAAVSRGEAQEALDALLGPDPDSRDGTTGERIRVAPRGWEIINHRKFRDMRSRSQILKAERQARWRAKNASFVDAVDAVRRPEVEAEVEVEAEEKKKGATRPKKKSASRSASSRSPTIQDEMANRPPGISAPAWSRWLAHQWARKRPTATAALQHRERLQALSEALGAKAAEDFMDQCIEANAQGIPRWAYDRAMQGQSAPNGRSPYRRTEGVGERLARELREEGIELE